MDKLTAKYEEFIKDKQLNTDGKQLFDKVLNKSVKASKKQHDSR